MIKSHKHYETLCHVQSARFYSFGWADRVKEPSERVFPRGPLDCDVSAGVEDGIYDSGHYIRKHNLVIDYLDDEEEWRDPQSKSNIPEDQSSSEAPSAAVVASDVLTEPTT